MNSIGRQSTLAWLILLLVECSVALGWFVAKLAEDSSAWMMVAYFAVVVLGLLVGLYRHNSPR